jgi:hypothetical protein
MYRHDSRIQKRSLVMQDMEQAIRERAYHLWVADGRPDGSADQHWLAAQREMLAASLGEMGRVTLSDASPADPVAGRKASKGKIASKAKRERKAA